MQIIFGKVDFQPVGTGWLHSLLRLFDSMGLTLPETNKSHLKMDGWNTVYTSFLLGPDLLQGSNC